MFMNRKDEPRVCFLCKTEYNLNKRSPFCLIPCGHTFCQKCISDLFNKTCPLCRLHFNQYIPDYGMLDLVKKLKDVNLNLENIEKETNIKKLRPEYILLISEGTKQQQLMGLTAIRKLLSIELKPPIQEIIDSGLVPRLIEFLSSKDASIQFETVWILTNIASGDSYQTKYIVDLGVIPKIIPLISSENQDVCETAIWALGNIAGDCSKYRDMVIDSGALTPMIKALSKFKSCKTSLIRNGIWTLSNLCRNKCPPVDLDKIECIFPILSAYISEYSNDDDIISDICWAVSYLSDGENERIQKIIDNFYLNDFAVLLNHKSNKVKTPVLRIIGNICTGDDSQTECILNCNILTHFYNLIDDEKSSIRKETCWAISNITAGNASQVQRVIDAKFIPKLIKILKNDTFEVRKEAAWAIANIFTDGNYKQIESVYTDDILECFFPLLDRNDPKINNLVYEVLIKVLDYNQEKKFISEETNFKIIDKLADNLEYFETKKEFQNETTRRIIELIQDRINELEQEGN